MGAGGGYILARTGRWALVAALAVLLGAACAGPRAQPDLPDFPEFEDAKAFLEMQRRLQAAYRPPPPAYKYTARNQAIYDRLEAQQRLSEGELAARARAHEEALRRARAFNDREWQALRQRLARDEALDALRDEERSRNAQRARAKYDARFRGYQARVERLAREQDALAREREQYALRNQQRIEARVEALYERQIQTIREREQAAEEAAAAADAGN